MAFLHVLDSAAYVAGWFTLVVWALAILFILACLVIGWAADIRKAVAKRRPVGGWLHPARRLRKRAKCFLRGHDVKVDLTLEVGALRAIKAHCERCGDVVGITADLYHLVGGQRLAAGGTVRRRHVH